MTDSGWRQLISRVGQKTISAAAPALLRLWENPLFRRERQSRPIPAPLLRWVLPITAGVFAVLSILAWAIESRLVSAVILAICLGAASIPALAAPITGAATVPAAREQSTFTTTSPVEAVKGAALIALWRLRWPIAAGLALTPALMISLLRLDIATFSAYRDSVLALGSAAPPEQAALLLPGGTIPYLRLVIRDISGGLLPWAALPASAALGVSAALLLDDVTFGQIAGLIATLVALLLITPAWAWLSTTPIFAGMFEIVRLVLLAGLLSGLVWLALWVTRQNARLLLSR